MARGGGARRRRGKRVRVEGSGKGMEERDRDQGKRGGVEGSRKEMEGEWREQRWERDTHIKSYL